ncbi:Na(+)/H(+) antiporter subunit B [Alkalilimnicola sp. S0819]|uniref:Na(+)/H(+) antiporter subunit B n=1 Tax=Alkalilimnicola sp. S0819 TaxID=2613922 RepID=UPI0012616F30|nr:hydrogenase subunit MbhD domain-containing protein [Alkalilimnicola sp. S0819]KAB7627480.1 DUF4040 domain-containing protein [Alkalilimnicola sp. S0819]MPQ15632.1 DUF4040 domain-containing protein [Alkalilimnicola sp. S0819]
MMLLFDLLLAPALLWVAQGAMSRRNLFQAVVLFIAFGLLLSLAWVRLRVPDVAMAEAAVSAGITGVLMLDALGRLGGKHPRGRRR